MQWTERQIELSRELAEEIEKKTGEKRAPRKDEWWMVSHIYYSDDYYPNYVVMKVNANTYEAFKKDIPARKWFPHRKRFLHPLFTEGDCLQILSDANHYTVYDTGFHETAWRAVDEFFSGLEILTIKTQGERLTALLELAVKVVSNGKEEK